jgi:MoxR-like ATPase
MNNHVKTGASEALTPLSVDSANEIAERMRRRLRAAVKGRDAVIDLLLIALLADGHVLLEDFPGSGKTTLARALGESLAPDPSDLFPAFRRIQFTPDLLPSDITGTNVFDPESRRFDFRHGPIFAHVVLADEINRTSPKVQAAMLEAMAEKQVTIDNVSHRLDDLFFVIATQNPLDLAGTYPLPTPQLDRFLFKLRMEPIDRAAELEVLGTYPNVPLSLSAREPSVSRTELIEARRAIRHGVAIAEPVKEALVDLARRTREDPRVAQGASTRALVLLLPALQSRAVLSGRDFVGPDDLAALAAPVLRHRISFMPGVEDPDRVVADALAPTLDQLAKAGLRRS